MLDLFYVLAIIAFFSLALLYVRGCARLGRSTAEDVEERHA